jgi:ribosome-associated translation inhibitor RaiA
MEESVDTESFEFEFYSEMPGSDAGLRSEAEGRLRELATGHTDLIGASVALEELSGSATPHRYEARVIAYMRPEDVVAVEKGKAAEVALKGALDAVERQIRQRRDKLREPWKQP